MEVLDTDEKKLIRKAATGDANAFDELMTVHEQKMYAVAFRICGNRDDAQDCLQDAMLRIYRSIGNFKFESSFSTWAYRITVNTCLDEFRRRKNKQNVSLDNLMDAGWSPEGDTDDPEKKAMQKDLRRALKEKIQQLPEEMRAAIVLRDIHGYAYEEIAGMLKINVGTVKSRISRAREKLRTQIFANRELF